MKLNIDIDDIVSKNEVLVAASHPWGLRPVLNFSHTETVKDIFRVNSSVVLASNPGSIGHEIAQLGAHDKVRQL